MQLHAATVAVASVCADDGTVFRSLSFAECPCVAEPPATRVCALGTQSHFAQPQLLICWLCLQGNSKYQERQNLAVLEASIKAMVGYKALSTAVVGGEVTAQVEIDDDDTDRVFRSEPEQNTTPVPWVNALLSTYAGVQLLNTITAFNLLQEGYGKLPRPSLLPIHMLMAVQLCRPSFKHAVGCVDVDNMLDGRTAGTPAKQYITPCCSWPHATQSSFSEEDMLTAACWAFCMTVCRIQETSRLAWAS